MKDNTKDVVEGYDILPPGGPPAPPPEKLPGELASLSGATIAAFVGGLLLTGFFVVLPSLQQVKGASASTRLVHIRAKIEAGEPLTDAERLLLAEEEERARGGEAP